MRKILLCSAVTVFSMFILINSSMSQKNVPVGFILNGDAISGNTHQVPYIGPSLNYTDPPGKRFFRSNLYTIMIQEVSPEARTYYNLQSNGVTHYIWQDAYTIGNIHAVFMVDPSGATGYPGRRTKYFFTADTGNTWYYVCEVPSTLSVRSGFPDLIVLSNGKEMVAHHTTDGGSQVRTQLYLETGQPGDGLFTRIDPGPTNQSGDQPIWPVMAPTQSVNLKNKVVFVVSQLTGDTCFWNVLKGANSFIGYHPILNAAGAGSYAVAQGPNNRMCIAYITNNSHNPSIPVGGIEYIESFNSGSTWGSPVRVFTPYLNVNGIGALRSIDALYFGSNIRILFGLVVFDPGTGGYYPDSTAIEKLWGPDINGGVPVTVDSLPGMKGSNAINGADVLTAVCRGVLGKSQDGLLYAAWMRARSDTSSWGDNYFDIYFGASYDHGLTWTSGLKFPVTNLSGPLRHCTHPSISPVNNPCIPLHHVIHIIYQSDSVPGSNINGGILQKARMMYARVIFDAPVAIEPAGTEIPERFALYQNYPNPFNPSTNIKFALPKAVFVTLRVYDMLGREVITLVNDYVPAGYKLYTYDGSNLASGIYFYTLTAGDFRDTKKMIIIK